VTATGREAPDHKGSRTAKAVGQLAGQCRAVYVSRELSVVFQTYPLGRAQTKKEVRHAHDA